MELLAVHDFVPDEHGGVKPRVLHDERVRVLREEVEHAVKSHPAVFDCTVVGVPDERFGSRVAAVVQLREGTSPDLEEIQTHCRTKIAGYKIPREMHLVAEVERSPTGKPDYRWARAVAMGELCE